MILFIRYMFIQPSSQVKDFWSTLLLTNPWLNRQNICGLTTAPSCESTIFFFGDLLFWLIRKCVLIKKNFSNLAAPMNKLFINVSIIEFGKRWITRTTTIVISQLLSRSQIDLTMTQHNIDQCTIKTSFLK